MLKWIPDWLNYRRLPFRHARKSLFHPARLFYFGSHSSRGKLTEHVLGLRPTAPSSAYFALSRCCWARLGPSVPFKRVRNAFHQFHNTARCRSWLFWEFARLFAPQIMNPALFLFLNFCYQIRWRATISHMLKKKFKSQVIINTRNTRNLTFTVVGKNSRPYWFRIWIERKSDDGRCRATRLLRK